MSKNKRQIEIVWSIEDVTGQHPFLTEEQAWVVLKELKDNHDAELGINWDVIASQVNDSYPNEYSQYDNWVSELQRRASSMVSNAAIGVDLDTFDVSPNIDKLTEMLSEAVENQKQYTEFSILASDINDTHDTYRESLWEEFDSTLSHDITKWAVNLKAQWETKHEARDKRSKKFISENLELIRMKAIKFLMEEIAIKGDKTESDNWVFVQERTKYQFDLTWNSTDPIAVVNLWQGDDEKHGTWRGCVHPVADDPEDGTIDTDYSTYTSLFTLTLGKPQTEEDEDGDASIVVCGKCGSHLARETARLSQEHLYLCGECYNEEDENNG